MLKNTEPLFDTLYTNLDSAMRRLVIMCGVGAGVVYAQGNPSLYVACGGKFEGYVGPFTDRGSLWKISFSGGSMSGTNLSTIETESVQDIAIYQSGGTTHIYVAAQDTIFRFNTLGTITAKTYFAGLKSLLICKNYIIAGRWYGMLPFLAIYDTSLNLIASINDITGTVYRCVCTQDTIYVLHRGLVKSAGWGDSTGALSRISLNNLTYTGTTDLGVKASAGWNSKNELHLWNGNLYIFGNEHGTIIKYSPGTGDTTLLADSLIIEPLAFNNNRVYGYLHPSYSIGEVDLNTLSVRDSIAGTVYGNGGFSSAAVDSVNNILYVAYTDWYSFGVVVAYNINGKMLALDTFQVAISPDAMRVMYPPQSTGIQKYTWDNKIVRGYSYDMLGRNIGNTPTPGVVIEMSEGGIRKVLNFKDRE